MNRVLAFLSDEDVDVEVKGDDEDEDVVGEGLCVCTRS